MEEKITHRLKQMKSLSDVPKLLADLIFRGAMYQLHGQGRYPTCTDMAELLELSRPAFYRRYPNAKKQIAIVWGDIGGSAVEVIQRRTKKPRFTSIQREYSGEGELRITSRP
jgi:hypothetical protein